MFETTQNVHIFWETCEAEFEAARETHKKKTSDLVKAIWSNYSDLTRPHPKWWFSKGIPPISGKSRLVKYYNLVRGHHVFYEHVFWKSKNAPPTKEGGASTSIISKITAGKKMLGILRWPSKPGVLLRRWRYVGPGAPRGYSGRVVFIWGVSPEGFAAM